MVSIPEDEPTDLLNANIQSGTLMAEANKSGQFINSDAATSTQLQCLVNLKTSMMIN